MATLRVSDVRIAGVASAVPERASPVAEASDRFGAAEVEKIIGSTGVRSRRIASAQVCASDLCLAAAEKLLAELSWTRDSIGAVVFVSQTPDYVLPATSCVLHQRLNLSRSCAAWDVNLGCSGFVYGLWQAAQAAAGGAGRTLLLVGDTINRLVSPVDRTTALLFGDAGAAAAIEPRQGARPMTFVLGTDGRGASRLMTPAGGFRQPRTPATAMRKNHGDNLRSDEELFLDGAEVFAFTLREVPSLVKETLAASNQTLDEIDYLAPHQANRFLLEHLARKMRLPLEKLPLALEEYGNTSGASIPLTLTHALAGELRSRSLNLLLAGFGVGWSWAAAAVSCGPIAAPEMVVVPGAGLPAPEGDACSIS